MQVRGLADRRVSPPSPPSLPPTLGTTEKDSALGYSEPEPAEMGRRSPWGPGQCLGKAIRPHPAAQGRAPGTAGARTGVPTSSWLQDRPSYLGS